MSEPGSEKVTEEQSPIEEAKPEEPKPEETKPEEPKPEEPKPEEPKPEEPKPEEPKPEEPKPEEPKLEEPAPPPPAPSILSVEPDHGPLTGGTALTVTGAAFVEGCKALLDGVLATTARESETILRVDTPARAQKGLVELRVVNPDGQLAVYEEDFRYDGAPVITGTEPSWLSTEGGAVLTILGVDFAPGCAVHLGDEIVPASFVNAGRLEAVSKKHDAGEVSLAVVNPDQQRAERPSAVRFAAPPVLAGIEPPFAFTGGGAELTLHGHGFEPGCAVLVDGAPVAAVTVVSEAEVRFVAPAHAATTGVDVALVNPTGLAHRLALALSYGEAPPQVKSIYPHTGPSSGGTEIVLRGHAFHAGAAVFVCGLPARASFRSPEELLVLTPAVTRDGPVDVRVVNPDDQACTVEKAFHYVARLPPPELREVSPARGSQAGGLSVAILGADFAEGAVVRFGAVPAVVRFLTHRELQVTTPASPVSGEVAVEVVNPDGESSRLDAAFTFEGRPAPEITGLSTSAGPTTGGTRVTLEGKNFTRDCAVFLGREHPKDFVLEERHRDCHRHPRAEAVRRRRRRGRRPRRAPRADEERLPLRRRPRAGDHLGRAQRRRRRRRHRDHHQRQELPQGDHRARRRQGAPGGEAGRHHHAGAEDAAGRGREDGRRPRAEPRREGGGAEARVPLRPALPGVKREPPPAGDPSRCRVSSSDADQARPTPS